MSKREYTFLGSPRSSPVKVLEEWPGSINLQLDSQHHTHASYSQSLSRATGPSSSTSGLPTASQMPEGMDIVGLESASLAKASRGNSIKDKDMLLASSFQNRERSGHGSEAMLGSHEGDPSEERFMTPPERRSRRSSPEGEESEKQGQSSHLMASGAQQPAVSRALVFQSLDSPDEDGPTYLEAHDDMAPRQHAPATDNDMTPMSTGMEDDDDDVTILDERPASRGGGSSRRQRRRERGTALGAAAGEGDEDAQGGDGDPQSQEDADLALAKAMQEQVGVFTGQRKAPSRTTVHERQTDTGTSRPLHVGGALRRPSSRLALLQLPLPSVFWQHVSHDYLNGLVQTACSAPCGSHLLVMQECAFLLLHQQQQQYSYSFSPGLAGTGSSNSQRLASRDDSGSSRGHRSNSGGLSQATDRLSVYPQDTTGAATGSQLLHQRQEQRQSQGEGQGPQGRFGSERGGSWEEPAFEESLQAFGDASGAPEEDTDNGEGAEISDEEFARRLQEEEERQMAARLMAMAGVGARPLVSGGCCTPETPCTERDASCHRSCLYWIPVLSFVPYCSACSAMFTSCPRGQVTVLGLLLVNPLLQLLAPLSSPLRCAFCTADPAQGRGIRGCHGSTGGSPGLGPARDAGRRWHGGGRGGRGGCRRGL